MNADAEVYIGPAIGCETPNDSSCKSVIEALKNIDALIDRARQFLVAELNRSERHKKDIVLEENLRPTGIRIFEHEKTPGEYSLTFNPTFDPGAIFSVRFSRNTPISWGFDD